MMSDVLITGYNSAEKEFLDLTDSEEHKAKNDISKNMIWVDIKT